MKKLESVRGRSSRTTLPLVGALAFVLLALVATSQASAQIVCNTTVPAGPAFGTWTLAGSPYCITGDLAVSLLTVEPGVKVYVDGPYEISVSNSISAAGTSIAPILFTAKLPDTPELQRWRGFKLVSGTPNASSFSHVEVSYANEGAFTLLNVPAPAFDNCNLHNNSRVGLGGAVSSVGVSSPLTFNSCFFSKNSSTSHGGVIYHDGTLGSKLTVFDSAFGNNTANPSIAVGNYVGGAIYVAAGDVEIRNSNFYLNRSNARCFVSGTFTTCSVTGRGGAIFISGGGTVDILNSTIQHNRAYASYGGWCPNSGAISQSFGGGLYVRSGDVLVANSVISCNETTRDSCGASPTAAGSGLFVAGGTVSLENSTIARNGLTQSSTGIHQSGGATVHLDSSIVYDNNNGSTNISGTPTAEYSDIQQASGTYAGVGNINFAPGFSGFGCSLLDLRLIEFGALATDVGNTTESAFDDGCIPPGTGSVDNDMGAYGGPGNCMPVPEPTTSTMLVAGIVLIGLGARRRMA